MSKINATQGEDKYIIGQLESKKLEHKQNVDNLHDNVFNQVSESSLQVQNTLDGTYTKKMADTIKYLAEKRKTVK